MTGQDWLEKDFYATLGVSKDADADAIKKAYRKLARTWHPDRNPGDAAAEAKFKDIGEAYAVLSDSEQRKQYDALRAMAGGGPRFTSGAGGATGSAGFEDLFGGMFGGGGTHFDPKNAESVEDLLRMFGQGGGATRRRGSTFGFGGSPFGGGFPTATRGSDVVTSARLPFRNAVEGSTVQLTVDGRTMTVRIPPGVHDGQKIRLRGKGEPGSGGGEAGDLVVTVHVEPHPVFGLGGDNNLTMTLPVTFAEAALGATITVPTLDGRTVRVKVPPGTPSGRTLRVKNHGVRTPKGLGDLLVTVNVVIPQKLNADAKAAVERFAAATAAEDPRAHLEEQARA